MVRVLDALPLAVAVEVVADPPTNRSADVRPQIVHQKDLPQPNLQRRDIAGEERLTEAELLDVEVEHVHNFYGERPDR